MSLAMCRLVAEEGCCLDVSSGGELAYRAARRLPDGAHLRARQQQDAHRARRVPRRRRRPHRRRQLRGDGAPLGDRGGARASSSRCSSASPRASRPTRTTSSDRRRGLQVRLRPEPGPRDGGGRARDRAAGHRLRRPAHAHRQPDLRAAQLQRRPSRSWSTFMREIQDETGAEVRMLDTGGGLGIAYGLPDEPSTIEDYGKVVVDGIKEECEQHGLTVPRMAVEPGRSDRRQRRRDALHRRHHQGDPEHPHVRRRRRRHVRQHPHRRSTTRTTRRSSRTRRTSRARWSRRWPASTARAATSS